MQRLFASVDPATGTRSYIDYDENDDALHFTEEVDTTRLIEWNKRLYNEASATWGDGATAAKLPPMLLGKLMREGIATDPVAWKRWLNDPDHRAFRIRPGRI